jgi:hypothetical protein
MARHVLGGPTDEGRASYQIALRVCPSCGGGQQQASGALVPVAAEVVAMAQCDGQQLGMLPSLAANENAVRDGAHPEKSAAKIATTLPRDAHVADPLAPSTDTHAVDAPPRTQLRPDAPAGTRAKQTIPPALRRAVLLRDQHRCRVPGCKNATFLDLHHIELRSEGGRNELGNVITLCGAHHRAAHRGQLVLESDAHVGVRFRHGDGTEYGQALEPRALEIAAKLFSALRNLGFREREVRAVLAELRSDDELRDASIECLLREALRRMPLPSVRLRTE